MLVFVYGSLKKSFYNHHILKDSKFIGYGTTTGKLYNLGMFPGMVEGSYTEGTDTIYGEVYQVNKETLQILDKLEGYRPRGHSMYIRMNKLVYIGDIMATCYAYRYNGSILLADYIEGGVWEETGDNFLGWD